MINKRKMYCDLEYQKLCLQGKLRAIEHEISNLNKRIPSYNRNESIKIQLEALLSAYDVSDAVKVVSTRRSPTKIQYSFELKKSRKILKIFNMDLGNRKLFNQANHYLNFISKYDIILIKRELELISFCIPEDTNIHYNIHYSNSEIDSISFSNVASNIHNMQYVEKTKQLIFNIDALPQVQCSISIESHKDLFLKIKYCQQLASKL